MSPLQTASEEKTAEAFLRWDVSYGFTIHQNNLPILDGSGRLGPAEVFDAEATGALEDPKAALNLRESASQNIFICLDNLAAATCLQGTPSDSSQHIFLESQALVISHGAAQVRWVPGRKVTHHILTVKIQLLLAIHVRTPQGMVKAEIGTRTVKKYRSNPSLKSQPLFGNMLN
ncbi:Uncharacterized protein HZ326_20036 [Fusarium oxysporum f. sp. albedinis]|nr:Uncharacterized protein HZ326_20036 [Fusarium oxysporum f. sp. albedinis]